MSDGYKYRFMAPTRGDTKSALAGADGADRADDGAGGADEDIISPLYPRTETRSVGGRRKETPH